MATSAITNTVRNLPVPMTGEVERLGYAILRGLDRLGFIHETRDGAVFTIRFDAVRLYGATWAAFHVDAERLYHFSVADLGKPAVLSQLSAVTKKPVRAFDDGGLAYVVELQPKPKNRLPDRVVLDLSNRPGGTLLVPLGVGRDGAVWRDLAVMGHTLVAGESGSGKSSWLHGALASLLTSCGPDVLRMALVDPKRVEFAAWANAPHLLSQVATDTTSAAALFSDLVREVERRGDLLASELCRDVRAYNQKAAEPLPYILCIVDEALDLVLQAGDKSQLVKDLASLASKARACGVILWLAAQHPRFDVLPRIVTANLVTRLVFRVVDSNAANMAGCAGAESLPRDRPGRLLAKIDGKPVELQGYWLPDADLVNLARKIAGKKATGPGLSEAEAALITWAVSENGGYLSLADIQQHSGMGQGEARRLASQWERRNWLIKDPLNSNRRRVSDELRAGVGL